MQKIITISEKEFDVDWAGVATIDGVLRFAVINGDMPEVFTTFSNPEETEVLVHTFDNIRKEYEGYTVFRGVSLNYQNEIIVALSKI